MINWFDPVILSSLKTMELRARLVVEGFLAGLHRSPYHGFSVEFAEHRPYQPGDEPRRIDWKVYARRDRFYTKQFEEETNLKAYIILDASHSMGYPREPRKRPPVPKTRQGSEEKVLRGEPKRRVTKFEYGALVAASLSWLLIHQKDAVSFTIFDKTIKHYLAPSAAQIHLSHIMQILDTTTPANRTNIPESLTKVATRIKRRGLIIFVSDLLAPQEEVIKILKNLRHRKNEVIVFHILDDDEIDFPFKGSMIFRDSEMLDEIPAGEDIRTAYQHEAQKFIATYRHNFYSNDIDYKLLRTSEPLDKSLAFYIAKRKKSKTKYQRWHS